MFSWSLVVMRNRMASKIEVGDVLERVKADPGHKTVREVCHLFYFDQKHLEGAKKALCIQALSPGWRG